jgi:serine/threonine protein kinase
MPLRDSFRQPDGTARATLRPNKLPRPPSKEDIEFTLQRARNKPQTAFGLQWNQGDTVFVLSVVCEESQAAPAWLLQRGTGNERTVAWSYKSYDVSHIQELIDAAVLNPHSVDFVEQSEEEIDPQAAEEPASKLVGTTFADQYEVIAELGEGGMGMVYKARDTETERYVAIKVLHKRLLREPTSKKRFEQEARAAMSLAHPNLISVYRYGFFNTTIPYLVMEFIDGFGLDDELKEVGQLDLPTFLDLFIQCCNGLKHAHQKRIIHRDLKPSNVMLVKNGDGKQIKIVDFGVSKMIEKEITNQDLTQEDQLIGSPYYMSPEQCKGEKVDARADIYALGCLMYQALTGFVPLAGDNALQTIGKHICEVPLPLMAVRPDLHIPLSLQNCILKALEKDPDDRQANVDVLQNQLQNIMDEHVEKPVTIESEAAAPTHFLVDVGDLPSSTYQAALKVQMLLRSGSMTLTQAAAALDRAHLQGGLIITEGLTRESSAEQKGIETPVEAILVEAGLIKNSVWKTVLRLQSEMRTGKLTKDEAMEEFRRQHPKPVVVAVPTAKQAPPKDILELILSAGLVSQSDVDEISEQEEDNTNLAKRLVSVGKLDTDILIAARQCLSLIERKRLPPERAIIALLYCQRSRVDLYHSFDELGWERP